MQRGEEHHEVILLYIQASQLPEHCLVLSSHSPSLLPLSLCLFSALPAPTTTQQHRQSPTIPNRRRAPTTSTTSHRRCCKPPISPLPLLDFPLPPLYRSSQTSHRLPHSRHKRPPPAPPHRLPATSHITDVHNKHPNLSHCSVLFSFFFLCSALLPLSQSCPANGHPHSGHRKIYRPLVLPPSTNLRRRHFPLFD